VDCILQGQTADMAVIIFSLIVFFNVKISLFFYLFFDPFMFSFLSFGGSFVLYCFLLLFRSFLSLFCWGSLGYFLGCDFISYGLILLSLWIYVLVVLARVSVFRFLFSCFLFVVILYCTFGRVSLLSFYVFLKYFNSYSVFNFVLGIST
jgi:NADH-ubiquinone oxidoreductase chain 4